MAWASGCYDFVVLPFFYLITRFMLTVFFYSIHFLHVTYACLFFFFFYKSLDIFESYTAVESLGVNMSHYMTHIHHDSYSSWLIFIVTHTYYDS